MSTTIGKREVGLLDGTPEKRMYWSIISDYDLHTGLCELIDNAIDLWNRNGSKDDLKIALILDAERQIIQIKDNAGGVKEDELRLLISPGASANDPGSKTIGIFGVGSKRAVVALAESVVIKTRYRKQKSFQIDIEKEWLSSDSWEIPHYEIVDIASGSTIIDLASLRKSFVEPDVGAISDHLSCTYAKFLENPRCSIKLNGDLIEPTNFEVWAFPPGFEPKKATLVMTFPDQPPVNVEIVAGLIRDRDPNRENYGVYFYCNNRLIVKELKVREVGYFVSGEAGVPHPDASLCRAIVKINGAAKSMPWNSSKSGVNFNHLLFQEIRSTLIPLLSHYSSLSRRFKTDWERKVFKHVNGEIKIVDPVDKQTKKRLLLPDLPRVNKTQIEVLKQKNKKTIHSSPWTLGLVEAMAVVDVIFRQKIQTKGRVALILLDSNFEIALKEFIVHRQDLFPPAASNIPALLKKDRQDIVSAVASVIQIPQELLVKARHYYQIRNKLIHEKATVDVVDSDIENYRITLQKILRILFDLRF